MPGINRKEGNWIIFHKTETGIVILGKKHFIWNIIKVIINNSCLLINDYNIPSTILSILCG